MSSASLIDAKRLLLEAGVGEGMRVADFGAGRSGHFVFPSSVIIGKEGMVYAVDVVKDVLGMIDGRRKLFGILNMETLWADFEIPGAVKIKDHSLDFVLFVNNLWCVENMATTLGEIRRVLKEDGKLFVVDWRRNTKYPAAPPVEKRLDSMQAEALLMKEGFAKERDVQSGEFSWGMLLRP
ncbi:methyltransferase domain-containing protein [Candidatus Uhrbacteria bacterium]|jgi:ubiquinone/menaquinone biosynthesis C-methylase UbiE|nr:methyltransferase domain-containing protein [Candidatus Uhrbacteria bacterium]